MKRSIYPRLQKSICSLLPCCILLLFSTCSVFAQSQTKDRYNFVIPKGQTLYSENTKALKDLSPFKKEYSEISDLGKTKVIESGNFVIKEYLEEGLIKQDTLWFAISELRILNGDTLKSSHKLELEKVNNFPIDAKLHFKKDRILIEQSDKQDYSIFAKIGKYKNTVHPDDEGLYFKKDQTFEYLSSSLAVGLMTMPIKVRLDSERGNKGSSAISNFKNLELFLGFRTTKYRYKNGVLKRNSFSLGPFIGPSVVQLNQNNALLEEGVERSALGINYGVAILGSIERVNLGVAIGGEFVDNNKELNWIHNNKLYLGFICGYSLNDLP